MEGVIEYDGSRNVLGNFEVCLEAYNHLKSELPVEKVQNSHLRISEIAITRKFPVQTLKKFLKTLMSWFTTVNLQYTLQTPLSARDLPLLKSQKTLMLKPSEILAIGDSENDIEFLQAVGLKVAVSNADQELKDIADYVTTSPMETGLKKRLRNIFLELISKTLFPINHLLKFNITPFMNF